jgi:transcriptional regulator with XRE-family HTH domain
LRKKLPGKSSGQPFAEERRVLSQSVVRAADQLGVSQKELALIVGVSESTVSRIRSGSSALERSKGKAFELAVLFVRLYVLLDSIVGGDQKVARSWLINKNDFLRERPIELLKTARGLVGVVQYLDQRSGRF